MPNARLQGDAAQLRDYIAANHAHCPSCGYLLDGLRDFRCPECGNVPRFGSQTGEPRHLVLPGDGLVIRCIAALVTLAALTGVLSIVMGVTLAVMSVLSASNREGVDYARYIQAGITTALFLIVGAILVLPFRAWCRRIDRRLAATRKPANRQAHS